MSLSIDEIRQRTSRARDLMRRSRLEGFAVGAFNIDNQETLPGKSHAMFLDCQY